MRFEGVRSRTGRENQPQAAPLHYTVNLMG
jgi:glycerol-3-phosphate O-acyltransferase